MARRLIRRHPSVKDGRPRRLERGHNPSIGVKARGRTLLGLLDPARPEGAGLVVVNKLQPTTDVEDTLTRGAVDRQRPQDTRLVGARIGVGERTDLGRGAGDGGAVTEMREHNGGGAH